MGKLGDFEAEKTTAFEGAISVRTTATMDYITDLLSELETIATLSGLVDLSNDIHSVLRKHKVEAFKD